MQHRLQAKLAKVVFPFSLLAIYVVWMQSRSDRVVSPFHDGPLALNSALLMLQSVHMQFQDPRSAFLLHLLRICFAQLEMARLSTPMPASMTRAGPTEFPACRPELQMKYKLSPVKRGCCHICHFSRSRQRCAIHFPDIWIVQLHSQTLLHYCMRMQLVGAKLTSFVAGAECSSLAH